MNTAEAIARLFVGPAGDGVMLFLAVFLVCPLFLLGRVLVGLPFVLAVSVFSALAGGAALLLAVAGVGPFPVMVGDAFALLGLGLVGAFIGRVLA